ncbi:sigma-70 family RNA polymerase sigma factor [Adhaeribacter rhizoryzae]|uniref:Sigma-70 family RNA polymerase sigma factor n=1 Tax=Adhaeribacter rhizoryzae TaxID=2607907 RepID=A0A5M6DMV5_9BACT|nr:sigma-70 family RNA polymerase sigma factor [Adhaeribacter rhizoryzae]KAA5546735.1 sigma-70 family RNA polymerase sigma factor [Adhaeribacter rhizoryzae]
MNQNQDNICCSAAPAPCNQVAPLFFTYEEKLKGFIRKQVRNPDITHDLTQELYLKIYQNCEQLPKVTNPKAWLYQVTRNAITDYYRANKPVSSMANFEEILPETDNNFATEMLELLEPLLAMLPEKYARPLYLSDIKGISQKEIALSLNLTLTNTKSRIQRGREKLKALFLKHFYLEFDPRGQLLQARPRPNCKPLQRLL